MGIFGNNGCYFSTVDLRDATGSDLQGFENFGFGLWSRESATEDYCVVYTATEENFFVDSKWNAARAMAVIANISGGVTMIICIVLSCVSIPQMLLKSTALLSLNAGFFQCLAFIYFSNDTCKDLDCSFARGAGVAVGAAVLYLVNSCIILKIPLYEGDGDEQFVGTAATPATQDPPPGAVQVTVTNMPDGTKKTVRTEVNADGSKTVTETIERPSPEVATATAVPSGSAEPVKTY